MASPNTRADSLRRYLTGAASDGGTQTSASAALGNYRSSTEALSFSIATASLPSGLTVDYAAGANPSGAGSLVISGSNVATWQPNGVGSPGTAVTLVSGNSYVLEAFGAPGSYIRVSCSNNSLTTGTVTVTLAQQVNNVFGMDDVGSAEATAGGNDYRAIILKNTASGSISSVKQYIGQLGTQQVSNGAQLGSSGSGTITTTGSFSDWPSSGWCQVRSSGGTYKETVYYTSRTSTSLTVPSAGRARLGSSATAGASSDLIYSVPGIAIAIDTAGVTSAGAIQTISDGNTAPTSVTWNVGLTSSTGLNIGTITTTQQVGIWIWRDTPAGATSTTNALNLINTVYDAA